MTTTPLRVSSPAPPASATTKTQPRRRAKPPPARTVSDSEASSSPHRSASGPSDNGDNEKGAPVTQCRYKTGRCTNSRVVKPNGTLLLLCEFHRDQQNRTKKRSDMKYRQDRAKKRQLERQQQAHSQSPSRVPSARRPSIKKTAVNRLLHQELRTRTTATTSTISPGKARMTTHHRVTRSFPSSRDFALSMASNNSPHHHKGPPLRAPGTEPPRMSILRPPTIVTDGIVAEAPAAAADAADGHRCLSPLRTPSSWAMLGITWRAEDVRLLEYFIL